MVNTMIRFILLVLFLSNAANSTEYLVCETGKPIEALRVKGCDKLPCEFHRGQDIEALMDFIVDAEADVLKPEVRVKALGMWLNYPIGFDDACDGHLMRTDCPLFAGDKATFGIIIPVLSTYPKISIDVEVTLKDQNENPVTCFFMSGKVVD